MPTSCTDLLKAMVGFDTVNSKISGRPDPEQPLARYLETQAAALGLTTQRLPISDNSFNLLITYQPNPQAPWLLFESHLDTVSTTAMSIDPLGGHIENNRLYGRGACDTKGTGAAMLWALKHYAGPNQAAANNVAIVYTIDEEITKTGVRTFVKDHLPTLGWRPAGTIVGEPTQLKAVVAHNGVVRWVIRTKGRAAHSSDPSKGRSAIAMMAKVIAALESNYIPTLNTVHPLTGKAQCSINVIQGGVQINIVPEDCEIHLDRRLVPGEDADQVQPAVEQILAALRRDDPQLEVSQDQPTMVDQPLDPAGGENFATFVGQVLDQMDLPSAPSGVGYGTDASSFGHAAVPALVLGPGDIAQAHTSDEWIDLDQLDQGVEVYLKLMTTGIED